MKFRNLPTRVATGAYILHSGLSKWDGDEEQAQGLHGMAAGAYPFLRSMKPTTFLKALSVGEMVTGVLLLTPLVPAKIAGAALTGFSGGLVGMYARTPALREPGSMWPSQQGTAISKDVWMLGIGTGLLIDALGRRRGD
ncbi:DoxX family membrane protein [Leekyejoonella antrihumi]|uniref:DoxX family membrane protein n=1 Tax=Leekyejoonella antrihumi TaxID=1660198 RepID=A0A563E0I6_9MICO|nr:DoxX family membrane protein [Leekyejoonella antrihumi]TWP36058.1 DoxX family membrane protein [Leekyejoonella antrihumi]